jgi:hypothetical protein
LITAITNTTAITDDRQRVATRGFANTIKAHQLLIVWGMQYDNGIRIEVGDADNPGPFVGPGDPKESLRAINALLDEGYGQLTADTTATFPFRLSSGFAGFDQPVTFAEVNRAIAARVQLYNENYDQALTALDQSFLDLSDQNLDLGVYHIFSAGGGDLLNPLWFPATATGESLLSHPSFVADAEAGDDRLSKAAIRPDTVESDDLRSNYNFTRYANNTAPIPIIRNEELILIYAEANVQLDNFTEAVEALNIIRNAHGLPDYAGPQDKASLIDEVLRQRRYSLFGEGHRWIDLRRYNRLDELPLDRPNDDVWVRYPVPTTEGN